MLTKKFFKTKDYVEVTFEFDRPELDTVEILGSWDGWEPTPMKRKGKGPFKTKVRMPQDGEFEFRYLCNREWWENDEAADAYRPNPHGSDNGVITTRRAVETEDRAGAAA